ncbi:MAG TPA: 16S rRNA (uracil(1498)-N(3))-methyltransferase [Methylibium sp.]|nr:16S rRNA (uracil(1498)-N(3))-methyltransferase [Methylibium sp.]
MPPRLHVPGVVLRAGQTIELPPDATRHVQVLRLQPGDALTLFDGQGGEWSAEVRTMGKREVHAELRVHQAIERELPIAVTLALAMPAGDRMDFVVEKATELGAAAIQPLLCERSVLKLAGERAERRQAHWRGVAAAAAEQCGRSRLPAIGPVLPYGEWLRGLPATADEARFVLSLADGALPVCEALKPALHSARGLLLLSGPEGGLGATEDAAARSAGLQPVTLGPRVLRAETAPLAVLGALTALFA